jgi:hypothetical protein
LRCLGELVRGKARLSQTQRSVLQGALALVEPHFPAGTTTVRFGTIRQRQRTSASLDAARVATQRSGKRSTNAGKGDQKEGTGMFYYRS